MNRFIISFMLLFIAGSIFLEMLPEFILESFSIVLASICAEIIQLFHDVTRYESTIASKNVPFSLEIVTGCNALGFSWLLCAAILALPVTWRYKLMAALLGFLSVQIFNIIRLISLFFIGLWFPSYFDWIHENLWPILFSLEIILLFFSWLWFLHRHEQLHVV